MTKENTKLTLLQEANEELMDENATLYQELNRLKKQNKIYRKKLIDAGLMYVKKYKEIKK